MRVNVHTALVAPRVVLVPYRAEHVATYHAWMQDAELRALTASEELSLEEEHEMQRRWQDDADKLTFIVLARPAGDTRGAHELAHAEIGALPMVGDVNLFFKGGPADEDFEVEVEVMIAERAYRRQRLAHAALSLLLAYAASPLHHTAPRAGEAPPLPVPAARLVARIGRENAPSIALFRVLGFEVVKVVEVFGEVEMRFRGPEEGGGGGGGVEGVSVGGK